ncbi:MAG: FadR/GntR family transcriptional regulator [Clostridiaceae bacterium]|jgi:GntR family transcriptional repressor for pyruvate dehydrogenase complex|nr:FadR/GntR family transcriptional regulator [Clostridiaceae bacterium]
MSYFVPIKKEKSHNMIVNQIKSLIDTNILAPGDKMPSEIQMAAEFDVSRNTIREAILVLEYMGYVSTKKGLGTFVSGPNPSSPLDKLTDLFNDYNDNNDGSFLDSLDEMRLLLEPKAAELAASRATQEDIDVMLECFEKAKSSKNLDEEIFFIAKKIHFAIFKAAKNPLLECILNAIYHYVDNGTRLIFSIDGRAQTSLEEHMAICEAIINHDIQLANQLMYDHISNVNRIIKIQQLENPDD